MKKMSLSVIGVILLELSATMLLAQETKVIKVPGPAVRTSETSDVPNAVVLSLQGKCEYSEDGVKFIELDQKHIFADSAPLQAGGDASTTLKSKFDLNQGAVVRTGKGSRVDIFFRRIGTTVRLQEETEVKFEKMSRSTKNGVADMDTLLDLRKGRIFTVVRSLIKGSTFEIRNAAGRSVVEGAPAGAQGRYIITADGTQVADKTSVIPLKFINDKGITVITAGQKFDAKEGKTLAVETPEATATLVEFDELHALADGVIPPAGAKKEPLKK